MFCFLETNCYIIFSSLSNVCCIMGFQQGNVLEFIANRDAKNSCKGHWHDLLSLVCSFYILAIYCNILQQVSCLLQKSINYKFLMAVNVFLDMWFVLFCLIFTLNFVRDVIFGNKLPQQLFWKCLLWDLELLGGIFLLGLSFLIHLLQASTFFFLTSITTVVDFLGVFIAHACIISLISLQLLLTVL